MLGRLGPDRSARTEALRAKITGFDVTGPNLPSIQLIDTCTTILTKGHVKHIAWEKCTSKDQEAVDDPIVRGLRITPDGLLMQDVAPDPKIPTSTGSSSETTLSGGVRLQRRLQDFACSRPWTGGMRH